MLASGSGNMDLVELCLNFSDVNALDSGHRSALRYGCKYPPIVSLLLRHEAVASYMDISGKTPLMRAAEVGCAEVVNMLVDRQVDLDFIDYEGMTALSYACTNGHVEAVEVLVRGNASLLISDMDDKTPLVLAAAATFFLFCHRPSNSCLRFSFPASSSSPVSVAAASATAATAAAAAAAAEGGAADAAAWKGSWSSVRE